MMPTQDHLDTRDPDLRILYRFDERAGIWEVHSRDEHFFSTGLERARKHAQAVFGQPSSYEVVEVDAAIDQLVQIANHGSIAERAEAARAAVDIVYLREMSLGVHDLSVLLDRQPEEIRALFDACSRNGTNNDEHTNQEKGNDNQ